MTEDLADIIGDLSESYRLSSLGHAGRVATQSSLSGVVGSVAQTIMRGILHDGGGQGHHKRRAAHCKQRHARHSYWSGDTGARIAPAAIVDRVTLHLHGVGHFEPPSGRGFEARAMGSRLRRLRFRHVLTHRCTCRECYGATERAGANPKSLRPLSLLKIHPQAY